MASPARHWWAYLLGGYATYAFDVARAGFLVSDALYQVADITKVLIAAHGGRLWAENNPDRGATFCFTVPVAQAKRMAQ